MARWLSGCLLLALTIPLGPVLTLLVAAATLAYALNPGSDWRAPPERLKKAVLRRRINYLKRSSNNQP